MPTTDSHRVAVSRFGYGVRAGETLPADPLRWLHNQIATPLAPPSGITVAEALRLRRLDLAERSLGEQTTLVRHARASADEKQSWATRRLQSDTTFHDRLVDFWFNHFTVAEVSPQTTICVGPFVREAIYPHILGSFSDMLVAVVRHPAMLFYLNNNNSAGERSTLGWWHGRTPNENLAREVLELHTITPAARYTQRDVIEFTKLLTGWNVSDADEPFGFVFNPAAHEIGPKTLMGVSYREGEQGGLDALRWLGTHPSTYANIARKLARHFFEDNPPNEVIVTIRRALSASGGSLKAAYEAMISHPLALQNPTSKFRSPIDYVLAAYRAFGAGEEHAAAVVSACAMLNQPLFNAPQPNGWPDTTEGWNDPEALMRRQDWALRLTGGFASSQPDDFLRIALGDHAEDDTIAAASPVATTRRQAASIREALTLILASPEFNYR